MPYKLFIFDFDGTLADTARWYFDTLTAASAQFGFRKPRPEEADEFRGLSGDDIIRRLEIPPWKLPALGRYVRERAATAEIMLFPGVKTMMRTVAGKGVQIAVVSSNCEEMVRNALGPELCALVDQFACGAVVFGGKAGKLKALVRKAHILRSEAIALGDEVKDLDAAQKAGVASGAVTWGFAKAELLQAHKPTCVFNCFEEVAALAA